MDRTGASCYIYAKASGMLAKSFTGSRAVNLFNAKSLQELWSLIFTEEVPVVPQAILAQTIEKKAVQKFIEEYKNFVNLYSKPYEVLVVLLQWFDFENIKLASGKLAGGKTDKIEFLQIKPFNIINYEKWPDLAKMTDKTELSWFNKIPSLKEENLFANKIDTQFVKKIWAAIQKLPKSQKGSAQKIIANHYSLMNITWALRLKVYYNMNEENIKNHLIFLGEHQSKKDLFAGEALKILDFKIDVFEDWAKWKYAKFLNRQNDSKIWKLDPAYFEKQVSNELIVTMKQEFHKNPFTAMVLITWFFIKRNELENIRTATEAIRLNVDKEQLMQNIV